MPDDAIPTWLTPLPHGVRLAIRVVPGARRTEVADVSGDELRIRLNAPPVDGKANTCLLEFLATMFGVRTSAVLIHRGQHARSKVVDVDGDTAHLAIVARSI